jgi:hypothetical protein
VVAKLFDQQESLYLPRLRHQSFVAAIFIAMIRASADSIPELAAQRELT